MTPRLMRIISKMAIAETAMIMITAFEGPLRSGRSYTPTARFGELLLFPGHSLFDSDEGFLDIHFSFVTSFHASRLAGETSPANRADVSPPA
jgi:hypothetical protein